MKPEKRSFVLLAACLLIALWVSLNPSYLSLWFYSSGLLLFIFIGDLMPLLRLSLPKIERTVAHNLSLGVWSEVKLTLSHNETWDYHIQVFDNYPKQAQIKDLPQSFFIKSGNIMQCTYYIRPFLRGNDKFSGIQILQFSPQKLWSRKRCLPLEQDIKIYPNFSAVAKYALLAIDNHLNQLGVKKRQRRGEGSEFHQLREYRQGDSMRQIDWNASSRLRKIISREYQDERNQQIIFLFDCGRRMRNQEGETGHFDHALNALLLLSWVALKQGDAVGLLNFASPQKRWFPPRKGRNTINAILNMLYDIQPSLLSADYLEAATQVIKHHNKRALIILISNIREEDNSALLQAIRLLRQRHLVLVASLREKALDDTLNTTANQLDELIHWGAVCHYLLHRNKAQEKILHSGALFLDVNPEALGIGMVNQYLRIKRSGLL